MPNLAFKRFILFLLGGAVVGKVLGLVREVVMARVIGVSILADAFRAGISAIVLPLAFLQGDTVPAALIPLHKRWNKEGRVAARFSALTCLLVMLGVVITILVELFARAWVNVLVGGFSTEAIEQTVNFVKIMALAMPFSVLFNCLVAVEVSHGSARLASARAAVQNTGILAGIGLMTYTHNPNAIAWGFTTSFIITSVSGMLLLLYENRLSGFVLKDVINSIVPFCRGLRVVIALPIAEQLQFSIERFFASSLSGTLAALDYARTLTDSSLYLVSQPIGLAVMASANRNHLKAIASPLLLVAMPTSIFLCQYSVDIITIVLAHGAFGVTGIVLTSDALRGISYGLWASTVGYILLRQLNGEGRNGTAALLLAQAYGLNILFNIVAHHLGAFGFGLGESIRGFALLIGTSISLSCTMMILRLISHISLLCLVYFLIGLVIQALIKEPIYRVSVGLSSCALMICVGFIWLMPSTYRYVLSRVVRVF